MIENLISLVDNLMAQANLDEIRDLCAGLRDYEQRCESHFYEQHYRGPVDLETIKRIKSDKLQRPRLRSTAQAVFEAVTDTKVPINDAMSLYGSDELAKALGGKFEKTPMIYT